MVAASILLLLAALTAAVVATRQLLAVRLIEQADRDMAQEVEELRALAGGTDPQTGAAFGTDAEALFETFLRRNVPAGDEAFYTFVAGRPYLTSFGAPEWVFENVELIERWQSVTAPSRASIGTGPREIRALAVPVTGEDGAVLGSFVVAIFPAGDRADVSRIVHTLLIIAVTVLVAASIASWSVAGRVLRPVRTLTIAARETAADDLTKRIQVEGNDELAALGNTFNTMLDRLDGSFRSQRAFLDDVAHELRTPLTIVRGHLEMIDDDPAERAATLQLVTDELDRMARYVDDLLVVAKAARPDFLQTELVDIGELIESAHQRARGLGDRAWTLGPAPAPATVLTEADPQRVLQALLALADNAMQHTQPGGSITIGADASPTHVRLWVTDDGPGVPPAEHDRIFQRFSRGSSADLRPDGTGLGLAIVDAIARAHRGRVELDSPPGEGATFRIVMPRVILEEDEP
ncbi:MAG: HAMP domain-containing sensor histidine kinase [Actinomycetota bacterium]|nr:HAMP domain-containing sensor histidine kinase [Actinomycetota bacterium]